MLRYSIKHGWVEVSEADAEEIGNSDNAKLTISMCFGWKNSFEVIVLNRRERKTKSDRGNVTDQFLVNFVIGHKNGFNEFKQVSIPSLPDLLDLLKQVMPICVEARKQGEIQEKEDEGIGEILRQ